MGEDEPGGDPAGGDAGRSGREARSGEASDADVRAAVESVTRGSPERIPAGVDTADADATDARVRVGGGKPSPADPGHLPDRDVHGHRDPDGASAAIEDRSVDGDPPAAGLTPTVAAVGVGIGLVSLGVVVSVYRTLLAAGADRFVAALYGVGGAFVIGGFVAHALWRSRAVDA